MQGEPSALLRRVHRVLRLARMLIRVLRVRLCRLLLDAAPDGDGDGAGSDVDAGSPWA